MTDSGQDNRRVFLAEYETLHHAAVGVTFIRTREGRRAQDALREFAQAADLPFKVWNCVEGWIAPTVPNEDPIACDVASGLQMIGGLDPSSTDAPWEDGVYVMHDLHYWLAESPVLIRSIRHYAHKFAESEQRLAIIVPETYSIPQELMTDTEILDFKLPSQDELIEVLEATVGASFVDDAGTPIDYEDPFDDDDKLRIISAAAGMAKTEAEVAFSKAIVELGGSEAEDRVWCEGTTAVQFSQVVMRAKVEIVKRSEVLTLVTPEQMTNVGGLELYKEWVNRRRRAFSPEAKAKKLKTPKGVLLVGPPGTGKSLAAKATASILGHPMLDFNIGSLFGGIVGETESRTRATLNMLEALAPCVVFIDEIDKALGNAHNSGGDSGVTRRLLGSILDFMQKTDRPVFFIFAANRADALPSELVRKGRLDEMFCVGPPNKVEREAIFRIHLSKQGHPGPIPLAAAVAKSEGFVGAEIEAAATEAALTAFLDDIEVTDELLAEQFGMMRPISIAFKDDFDAMRKWAADNAKPASLPSDDDEGGHILSFGEAPRMRLLPPRRDRKSKPPVSKK